MKPVEDKSRTILTAQLLKSIVLLIIYSAIVIILTALIYRQWQAVTGVGWTLFLIVEAAVIVVAYKLGMIPAAKMFFKKNGD